MTTRIPLRLAAGTTVKFTRGFDDFSPTDGWAYTFYLVGPSTLNKAGSPVGTEFEIILEAAETDVLSAGSYRYAERAASPSSKAQKNQPTVRYIGHVRFIGH